MTLDNFFENHVLPIMGERQDSADSYEDTYVGVINTVLADCLNIENAIREKNNKEKISLEIYGAEDEIPYDTELLINCISYGVASRLFVEEAGDESNKFIFLENNYQDKKDVFINALYVTVDNVWGVYNGNE